MVAERIVSQMSSTASWSDRILGYLAKMAEVLGSLDMLFELDRVLPRDADQFEQQAKKVAIVLRLPLRARTDAAESP
jgi:hypothetical protein